MMRNGVGVEGEGQVEAAGHSFRPCFVPPRLSATFLARKALSGPVLQGRLAARATKKMIMNLSKQILAEAERVGDKGRDAMRILFFQNYVIFVSAGFGQSN